jgi:hypothetical protein
MTNEEERIIQHFAARLIVRLHELADDLESQVDALPTVRCNDDKRAALLIRAAVYRDVAKVVCGAGYLEP